jgi:hypothetical protein
MASKLQTILERQQTILGSQQTILERLDTLQDRPANKGAAKGLHNYE